MLLSCCMALPAIAQQDKNAEPIPIPITEIKFDSDEYDFGKIEQGEVVEQIFRLTNTGRQPLLISGAKGSCGCTVPSWPKGAIEPGGTAAIVVRFNSKGKIGRQTKRITITANTQPQQTFLTFKGEIYRQADIPKIPETPANIQLSVFPNPTADRLSLKIKDAKGKATDIEIFNKNGQLMERLEILETATDFIEIDVSEYVVGSYWLSVQVGDGERVSLPFVVAR